MFMWRFPFCHGGTPKSANPLDQFGEFWGSPIFRNTHIKWVVLSGKHTVCYGNHNFHRQVIYKWAIFHSYGSQTEGWRDTDGFFSIKINSKWLLNLVTWGIPMFFLMGIPKVTGFFASYTHQNMSVYSKYCFLTGT